MLEAYLFSYFWKLLGIGVAIGSIIALRRSLKQAWPKADPEAWKDKDHDWW